MSEINISITKNESDTNDLVYSYNPLQVIDDEESKDFITDKYNISLSKPIDIECQQSYDDSVNLIINDGLNKPILVNSGFAKVNDTKAIVNNANTKYDSEHIVEQTKLTKTIIDYPWIELDSVSTGGSCTCGNYTFYIKYGDADGNKTDFVAESGIVSIFKGSISNIKSINGGVYNEKSDKLITLIIKNIDAAYNKIYVYYSRSTSDTNGITTSSFYSIKDPYDVTSINETQIIINGSEDIEEVNEEELNIVYNVYDSAQTITQTQNMLFLGNVTTTVHNAELQQFVLDNIRCICPEVRGSVGYVYPNTYTGPIGQEYYDVHNIYSKLGYWPNEYYRLGIVFIFDDGTKSNVYNIKGNTDLKFVNISAESMENPFDQTEGLNDYGIIKTPQDPIISINEDKVSPIHLAFAINNDFKDILDKYNITNFFFVRQPRIPLTVAQGLCLYSDASKAYLPFLPDAEGVNNNMEIQEDKTLNDKLFKLGSFIERPYIYNSIKDDNAKLTDNVTSLKYVHFWYDKWTDTDDNPWHFVRIKYNNYPEGGESYPLNKILLCLDSNIVKSVQSLVTGEFELVPNNIYNTATMTSTRVIMTKGISQATNNGVEKYQLIYIPEDTKLVAYNDFKFSSRAGNAETPSDYSVVITNADASSETDSIFRGVFCGYIGIADRKAHSKLCVNTIYDIRLSNENIIDTYKLNNSPYYSISNIYNVNVLGISWNESRYYLLNNVYKGDCYTNTVTIRFQRNFIDPSTPTNNTIVEPTCWNNFNGASKTDWSKINRADTNNSQIGCWITYKCLSNYNLGLRSEDKLNSEEMNKMGNFRSFYPLRDTDTSSSNKIPESDILNQGYSTTLSKKKNFTLDTKYVNNNFRNRIAFSNVQVDGAFENSYRTFQGLSYQDIENQYGPIVKLLPYGSDLFCVFEHGCAIVPINEKALLQTVQGQAIHIYGSEVLQKQITVISPDYGSLWKDSIIRTPNGFYGVDTSCKKIWRYNNSEGFVLISDMKVQRFLNDNLTINNVDLMLGIKNVKTHYNNYKMDVMFTFYTDDKEWNLCFNERLNTWVSKYSWTPLLSENIDNSYVSFDKKKSELIEGIWRTLNDSSGDSEYFDFIANSSWDIEESYSRLDTIPYKLKDNVEIISVESITYGDADLIEKVFDKSYTWNKESTELEIEWFELKTELYWYKITFKILKNNKESLYSIYRRVNKPTDEEHLKIYNQWFSHSLYAHGKGLFDQSDNISPTKWYDKQEPFEFEFIVNTPFGLHKIFDNLVIISNNVEPNSLEIEIIGDVYSFNKSKLFKSEASEFPEVKVTPNGSKVYKTNVIWDKVLNQYGLNVHQDCININKYGRRLGNLTYLEDKWNITLQPIYYKESKKSECKTIRLRDKFAKIRIKYSGEQLAIITSIQTLMRLSYA